MKPSFFFFPCLLLLMSACTSGSAQPTTATPDLDATVGSLAETIVAGTKTALVPISTQTPIATVPLLPSATADLSTATITPTTTPAPIPWGCSVDGRTVVSFQFQNNSDYQVYAVLDSPICHREFIIDSGFSVTQSVPAEHYSYFGYIGADTSFGGGVYLSDDIHTWILYISNDGARLETP